MSFTIEKAKDFNIEEGVYLGALVTLVDMGIQSRGTFNGEKLEDAALIGMEFEIVKDDGSRSKIYKEVVKSGHEQSTMFKFATALHGGGKSAEEALKGGIKADSLIGKWSTVTVGTTSGGKSKVTGLTALRKGESTPDIENELVMFSVKNPDEDALAKLPKFVQTKLGVKLNKEDDEVDF